MRSSSRIVARVGEQDGLDRARAGRAARRVQHPVVVARQQREDLRVELLQLLGGDVQQELLGPGRPLPGGGQRRSRLQAPRRAVEVAVGEQPLQRAPRGLALGVLGVVDAEAQPVGGQPPRPPSAGRRARLLDEPELGQLAQVPGAARRALADVLGRVGGRQRPVLGQRLQQPEADRVGQGAQLTRVGQLTRFESDLSKDSFRRTTGSSADL
jgi:hypothetical protein